MNFPVRILTTLAAVALAGTALPAFAEQISLSAVLTGGDEVPATTSSATGAVEASYDTDTNLFSYAVSYDGLTGEATAAHFHGPANPGENAPPVVPVDGDLTSPITGTATLTDAQEADLLGGMWYFNVHTAQFPDGEIRGQVMQSMMSSESSMMSSESSMMSSEMPSSEMSSSEMSSSVDVSTSVSVSASASVDPGTSSVSSAVSSAVSDVSSAVSSAVSDVSSTLSSALDPSVSASASGEVSVSVAP